MQSNTATTIETQSFYSHAATTTTPNTNIEMSHPQSGSTSFRDADCQNLFFAFITLNCKIYNIQHQINETSDARLRLELLANNEFYKTQRYRIWTDLKHLQSDLIKDIVVERPISDKYQDYSLPPYNVTIENGEIEVLGFSTQPTVLTVASLNVLPEEPLKSVAVTATATAVSDSKKYMFNGHNLIIRQLTPLPEIEATFGMLKTLSFEEIKKIPADTLKEFFIQFVLLFRTCDAKHWLPFINLLFETMPETSQGTEYDYTFEILKTFNLSVFTIIPILSPIFLQSDMINRVSRWLVSEFLEKRYKNLEISLTFLLNISQYRPKDFGIHELLEKLRCKLSLELITKIDLLLKRDEDTSLKTNGYNQQNVAQSITDVTSALAIANTSSNNANNAINVNINKTSSSPIANNLTIKSKESAFSRKPSETITKTGPTPLVNAASKPPLPPSLASTQPGSVSSTVSSKPIPSKTSQPAVPPSKPSVTTTTATSPPRPQLPTLVSTSNETQVSPVEPKSTAKLPFSSYLASRKKVTKETLPPPPKEPSSFEPNPINPSSMKSILKKKEKGKARKIKKVSFKADKDLITEYAIPAREAFNEQHIGLDFKSLAKLNNKEGATLKTHQDEDPVENDCEIPWSIPQPLDFVKFFELNELNEIAFSRGGTIPISKRVGLEEELQSVIKDKIGNNKENTPFEPKVGLITDDMIFPTSDNENKQAFPLVIDNDFPSDHTHSENRNHDQSVLKLLNNDDLFQDKKRLRGDETNGDFIKRRKSDELPIPTATSKSLPIPNQSSILVTSPKPAFSTFNNGSFVYHSSGVLDPPNTSNSFTPGFMNGNAFSNHSTGVLDPPDSSFQSSNGDSISYNAFGGMLDPHPNKTNAFGKRKPYSSDVAEMRSRDVRQWVREKSQSKMSYYNIPCKYFSAGKRCARENDCFYLHLRD